MLEFDVRWLIADVWGLSCPFLSPIDALEKLLFALWIFHLISISTEWQNQKWRERHQHCWNITPCCYRLAEQLFFLHNVYFCHLSHVTKSDIVNLLCKPQRNEILFDEVTRENVGKLRATPHLPFRVDTTWSGIDTIHQPKNVKKKTVNMCIGHLTSFVEWNWKLLRAADYSKLGN